MSVILLGIGLLIVLLLVEVPVAIALAVAGAVGLYVIGGEPIVASYLGAAFHEVTASYVLLAVPMFVLMSQYLATSGMARDIVQAGDAWLGRLKGGLALACVGSAALLAAVIGTSTAACAAMASAIYPTMREVGYRPRMALGVIVISGTLAIMIPPGLILIIYGILTEESIGKLLIAGVVPGLMTALGYALTILVVAWRRPDWVPNAKAFDREKAVAALGPVSPVVLLVAVVIGSLYAGIATPTEVGALGAIAALVIILALRRLTRHAFFEALRETVSTTVMIIAIITGAMIFGYFLTLSQATQNLIEAVHASGLSPWTVLLVLIGIYLVLGMFMDQMAILVLTVPSSYALISSLGFDGIWFGILITKTVEIGLVTPPLGLNVFVASGITGVKSSEAFKGVVPFLVTEAITLALLLAFPGIALWLPSMSGAGQ